MVAALHWEFYICNIQLFTDFLSHKSQDSHILRLQLIGFSVELGLFCGYKANISQCYISHLLDRLGYIAIYRNYSAHFYELGMYYEVFYS